MVQYFIKPLSEMLIMDDELLLQGNESISNIEIHMDQYRTKGKPVYTPENEQYTGNKQEKQKVCVY